MKSYFGDINAKIFLADLENSYVLPEPSNEISAWYFLDLEQLMSDKRTSIGVKMALEKIVATF